VHRRRVHRRIHLNGQTDSPKPHFDPRDQTPIGGLTVAGMRVCVKTCQQPDKPLKTHEFAE
jgi:hypothetical protein